VLPLGCSVPTADSRYPKMARLTANGLQLEVESFGANGDPAVLLIMGLGMQLTAWPDLFCQALASAGYRVVRFDNRDIGLSDAIEGPPVNVAKQFLRYALRLPIDSPYRVQDMAEDARGVLDALQIDRAHVIGASMGGMIAQSFAASWPERSRSLVSIMSTSGDRRLPWSDLSVLRKLLARPPRNATFDQLVEHYVQLFRALSGPGFPIDDATLRARLQRSLKRSFKPAGTLRQLLAIAASGDRSAQLQMIRCPTLVLHGDADPLVPLAHGRDCAVKIPGARIDIVPGMGHDLPPTLVPLLTEHVLSHLRAVDQRAPG
jgi:pimeloyl-ACP methyl ester carboxylesterase